MGWPEPPSATVRSPSLAAVERQGWSSLRRQFLLSGGFLVAATVLSGLLSAGLLARLSSAVNETLRDSRRTIDLTAILAESLEREDDALLLSIAGEIDRAARELRDTRDAFEAAFEELVPLLTDPEERQAAADLRQNADLYRQAGDELVAQLAQSQNAILEYHDRVNPALRRAVDDIRRIRASNDRSMQAVGIQARDEARRASLLVLLLVAISFTASVLVAVRLARSILGPIRELTTAVEEMRAGNFDRRVDSAPHNELGLLARGFNRLAQTLGEYRASSLGELLAAKTTLEATLNALPDAVAVVDAQGQIVALNPPAQRIFHGGEQNGDLRLDGFPLPASHRHTVEKALQGRPQLPSRTEFRRLLNLAPEGRPRKYSLSAVPVPRLTSAGTGAVVVLDDVTDIVRLDELRTELIAVASHELKTPLTTLRMNLLLLAEEAESLTPRQRELLATAEQGCEELAVTIDELLDMTRIEAGQLRLSRERLNLGELARRTAAALRPRFDDARVRLLVLVSGNTTVEGDAARLRSVFLNLLTNALKYTPQGGTVTVRVDALAQASPGGDALVQVRVEDTGRGVPLEYRERIFEKFFRVEQEQSENADGVRGTGIGLYLCREIIEAHGGTIRCEPGEAGRGTRILFRLPAAA
jgi:NtrC-family two-component system sensor histidine kinase KinB